MSSPVTPSAETVRMASFDETKSRVVDLLRFKAEHGQRRLNFIDERPRAPRLGLVQPFRPLTSRQIEHRQRMQKFLQGGV